MLGMRAGSSVADWALDECFFDPEVNNRMGQYEHGTGNSEHLYPAYRQWCEDTGRHKPVGSNIFKKRLFEVGTRLDYELSDSKNSKNQIIVLGVCLKSRATLFSKVPSVPSVPSVRANPKTPEGTEGTEGTNQNTSIQRNSEWLDEYDRARADA